MKKSSITLLYALFLITLLWVVPSYAQQSTLSIANSLFIRSKNIKEGDIITVTSKGYELAAQEYDPKMIGVVVDRPAVFFDTKESTPSGTKKYRVISQGTAFVNG